MNKRFILYRIIGNALPPRHGPADTYTNLKFILENEPDLPGAEKRWLLNRLIDTDLLAQCTALIVAKGQKYDTIPFVPQLLHTSFLDPSGGMPKSANPFAATSDRQVPQPLHTEWLARHKSQAIININQARNTAIDLSRHEADWILPLDGSIIFTRPGWDEFTAGVLRHPDAHYAVIPMTRAGINAPLADITSPPSLDEEPQLAFRADAPDRFDERLRYGNRNKAELLVRLGVPGRWHEWHSAPWEFQTVPQAKAPRSFFTGGWVLRLAPGTSAQVEKSDQNRFLARFSGVLRLSNDYDSARIAAAHQGKVNRYAGNLLNLGQDEIVKTETILRTPICQIADKKSTAPSGNKQDYFSLGRYLHKINGQWTLIDGTPNATAHIGSEESRLFDRTAVHECIHNASSLVSVGMESGRPELLTHAARILHIWFGDRETRMNPHARFAQFDPRAVHQANPAGLIDLRDLWTLPYLAETLQTNNMLEPAAHDDIRQWVKEFLSYLLKSEQGQEAYLAQNNIGTWTHLLQISLHLFINDYARAALYLNATPIRLAAQCDTIGMQILEMRRPRPLHYALFNLTSWVLLANLGRSVTFDIWQYRGAEGQSLCQMLQFIQNNLPAFKEFHDDPAHFRCWFNALVALTPRDARDRDLISTPADADLNFWPDSPDTGLPPKWRYFLNPELHNNIDLHLKPKRRNKK